MEDQLQKSVKILDFTNRLVKNDIDNIIVILSIILHR